MAAVEKDMYRLPRLIVHSQAASCHNLLNSSVLYAVRSVVASITYLERLMLEKRLFREELIVEGVSEVVFLLSLEFNGMRSPCTAPSAAHRHVAFL